MEKKIIKKSENENKYEKKTDEICRKVFGPDNI